MPILDYQNQVGRREDLSDVISVVDARSCLASSIVRKGKELTNPLMQWQADDYLDPSTEGVMEKADRTTFENHSGRQMLYGRIQITERAPMVSRVAQNVANVAGVGFKKEMAKSIAKAIIVAKRDIEVTILSDIDSQEDNGIDAPFQTRGLFKWIEDAAQGDEPVPAKFRTPTDSIYRDSFDGFTERMLRENILGSIWDQSGMVDEYHMLVGRQLKALITNWTIYTPNVADQTVCRTFYTEDENVIHKSVDVVEGDFGTVKIALSPWLLYNLGDKQRSQRAGVIFPSDMLELRFNKFPSFRAFEDKGGGPRGIVEAIWGLVCYNPLGMGKIDPDSVSTPEPEPEP